MQSNTVLKLLGLGILIASIYYVIQRVDQSFAGEIAVFFSEHFIAFIGAVLLYSAGLVAVAAAWFLLFDMSGAPNKFWACGRIYAYANIVKYLPGNVFHFGARQVLMLRLGASHAETAMASLKEALFLLISAAALCTFLLSVSPLFFEVVGMKLRLDTELIAPLAWLLLVVWFALVWLTQASVKVLLFYLVFHSLAVASFLVFMPATSDIFMVAAFLLISWIVGFCVPGAPGGLGVREAAFIYMVSELTQLIAPGEAVICIALFRLVTTMGDITLMPLMWGMNMVSNGRND